MSYEGEDILAVIPARSGSKGIPGKNIKEFCGQPLIYYTIKAALDSDSLKRVFVSTDSEKIAEVAKKYGAEAPFLRPPEISGDDANDLDFLQHALKWVEENLSWNPTFIMYLHPTTPTRTAEDIDGAVSLLRSTGADSVRTMVEFPGIKPSKMWKVVDDEDNRVEALFPEGTKAMPRQQLPKCLMPVGAVYITRSELVRSGRIWGDDVRYYPFPRERFTDIDTPEDLREAEEIMKKITNEQ